MKLTEWCTQGHISVGVQSWARKHLSQQKWSNPEEEGLAGADLF